MRCLCLLTLFVGAGFLACGSTNTGGKSTPASLAGLVEHAAVQAIEDGGEGDSYVVNVNLELGTYRVSHGKSLARLASAEGACTTEEVDVGRRLFTLERVEGYAAADATSGERTLKFTVLWPDGFPKSKTVFALDALAPGVAGAEAAAYTRGFIDRYAPPAPAED